MEQPINEGTLRDAMGSKVIGDGEEAEAATPSSATAHVSDNAAVMAGEGSFSENGISQEKEIDVKVEPAQELDGAASEHAQVDAAPAPNAVVEEPVAEGSQDEGILEPNVHDVLNGRGASVNAHTGNMKFRALCFARKPEFEAGNHAAKRRIATEIVGVTKSLGGRFLKRRAEKGPWYELSNEKSILKACQVMRDYQRPDRIALREVAAANGARKRLRMVESTPGAHAPPPAVPLDPIIENPFGVHDHDVLSGRGAFVNGHVGNKRFRELALQRKPQFDSGNYAEKRALATEIVRIIRSLDPPGRFLKRVKAKPAPVKTDDNWVMPARGLDGSWEELSDDKAIHKACQVMRDIDRPDRVGEKRSGFMGEPNGSDAAEGVGVVKEPDDVAATPLVGNPEAETAGETEAEATAVQEAVAATEEALDKALATSMPKLGDEDRPTEVAMEI